MLTATYIYNNLWALFTSANRATFRLFNEHPLVADTIAEAEIVGGGYAGIMLDTNKWQREYTAPTAEAPAGEVVLSNKTVFTFGPATDTWERIRYYGIQHSARGMIWIFPVPEQLPIIVSGQSLSFPVGDIRLVQRDF